MKPVFFGFYLFSLPHLFSPLPAVISTACGTGTTEQSQFTMETAIPPRPPEESLNLIQVRAGFEVELMASEPMVMDPITLDWGPDGKVWVVEMADFPTGMNQEGEPGGRIRFLEDTDGDARFDRSVIFLDHLPYPTSVMPWRNGVLVAAAPDIFYAEDTDGDGKADRREVFFSGFGTENPEWLLNSLCYGLDNWVYGGGGPTGGKIASDQLENPIDLIGMDFRIRPDERILEAIEGDSQFGRCRDDWGNWFGCISYDPMFHLVLAESYLRRNPDLIPPQNRKSVPAGVGAQVCFPISQTLPRVNDAWMSNRFTSCCGVTVYRDDFFGPDFEGNSFVCEPVHNLIHREIVAQEGVTFASRRADDELRSEFLASGDSWFRPTTVRMGPDGALWITDMYRFWIEHPNHMPEEISKNANLRAGEDRGRIYRVFPSGKKPRPLRRLDQLSTLELTQALESPNGRERDMIQQLLVHRGDKAAVPALEALAAGGQRPTCRLHALCALEGLGELKEETALAALADPHSGVRRHAIRLCEPYLSHDSPLGQILANLVDDPDPMVRLQLAYTLGEWRSYDAGRLLGKLMLRDQDDEFSRAATVSSLNHENLVPCIDEIFNNVGGLRPGDSLAEALTGVAIRMGHYDAVDILLDKIVPSHGEAFDLWRWSALAGFLRALDFEDQSLSQYVQGQGVDENSASTGVFDLFEPAREMVMDPSAEITSQWAAIDLLGYQEEKQEQDFRLLLDFLSPGSPTETSERAVSALKRFRDSWAAEALLEDWTDRALETRKQILDLLLVHDTWSLVLLDRAEKDAGIRRDVDAYSRQKLLHYGTEPVRKKAQEILSGHINPDRRRVIEEFQSIEQLVGNPLDGRTLFENRCGVCHFLGGLGREHGPDLAALSDKSDQSLLVAVLDPNRKVEMRHRAQILETKDGETLTGLITHQGSNYLTLLESSGEQRDLLRKNVVSIRETALSIMPEGLEADLSAQDFADLFAFVREESPAPKRFAGNRPEVVRPEPLYGEIWLLATQCEIYGDTLEFDENDLRLQNWSSSNDFAAWEIEVDETQAYSLLLYYSCPEDLAGNEFVVEINGQRIEGRVGGTESSEIYYMKPIGRFLLTKGRNRLAVKPIGRPERELLRLRTIGLKPVKEN